MECRRKDGTEYPALTWKQLCCGIQRYLKEDLKRQDISFFEGPEFAEFRTTIDARMKQLNNQGIGAVKKQAQPITPEREEILWQKGLFSLVTAKGIHQALYFYNSKVFGLRAADEHSHLCVEQFSFGKDSAGEYV